MLRQIRRSGTAIWLVAAVTGVTFGLLAFDLPLAYLASKTVYQKDFLQDYLLARTVLDGVDPYLPLNTLSALYQVPEKELATLPSLHPPTMALLLVPLAVLPYPTAAVTWLVLEIACLGGAIHLLRRTASSRSGPWQTVAITVASMSWYPVRSELASGQLMTPILLLFAAMLFAVRSDQRVASGVLLGLTMFFKPILWPMILLFALRRDWCTAAVASYVAILGYVIAGCVIGFDRVAAYFTEVLPAGTASYQTDAINFSLWALGRRAFEGMGPAGATGMSVLPFVQSTFLSQLLSFALPGFALLAACVWGYRQRDPLGPLAVMICVSLLISPLVWPYYLVLTAVPIAQVLSGLRRSCWPHREVGLTLFVAVLLWINWTALAMLVAEPSSASSGASTLSPVQGILLWGPTFAIGLLGLLVALLAGRAGIVKPIGAATLETLRTE